MANRLSTLNSQPSTNWRYAADFKTNTGKQLGVKLTRRAPGVGELEVYFDPALALEEKIISGVTGWRRRSPCCR